MYVHYNFILMIDNGGGVWKAEKYNHLVHSHSHSGNSDKHSARTRPLRNRFFSIRHGQSRANVAGIIASDPTTATVHYGLSDEGLAQAKRAGETLVRDFLEERRNCINNNRSNDDNRSNCNDNANPPIGITVVTSDFTRARETANALVQAVRDHNRGLEEDDDDYIPLYCSNDNTTGDDTLIAIATKAIPMQMMPTIDVRLRERWFGDWDGSSDVHYRDVWNEDAIDPFHTKKGVESVWSVVDRATALVCDWDERCSYAAANDNDNTNANDNDNDNTASSGDTGCMWVICVAHGDVLQILQTAFCHATMDPSQHRSLEHLETATMRSFQ